MTVITKLSSLIRKDDVATIPVCPVHSYEEQDVGDLEVALPAKRRSQQPSAVFFLAVLALLVLSAGFLCGMELYGQYLRSEKHALMRFQGICSVPIEGDEDGSESPYLMKPLHFYHYTELVDDLSDDVDVNSLREEMEIGDTVEKISVRGGPTVRTTSFIHDFVLNLTGIVDVERCYIMPLDRHLSLTPAAFAAALARGDEFDVSRMRDAVRVRLPADLAALAELARAMQLQHLCYGRPVYQLERIKPVIRKRRSVDAAPSHFLLFAGRHVHDIAVANMPELQAYERLSRG